MHTSNEPLRYQLLYPLILILILSPLCFYGFDFTDLGYHLTNQLQANDLGLKQLLFNPYWGGSDIVGGLWIRIFGEELWHIRLFPILMYGACLFALSLETKPSHCFALFIITLFSASPMPGGMLFLADYYTLPMLGITCWALIWFRLHQNPDSKFLLVSLAFFSFAITFLRLPLLVLLLIPGCMFIVQRKFRKALHWALLGLVGLIFLYFSDVLNLLFEGLKQQALMLEKTSGFTSFIPSFIRHSRENLLFFIEIIALIYLVKKISKKTFLECAGHVYIFIFFLAILDAFSVFQEWPVIRGMAHSCFKRGLNSLHLLMLFSIVKGIIKDRTKFYLLPIAAMPFILNFGTNTGISKMNYLLPCTFFCLIHLYEINLKKKVLAALFILSIPWNYKNFYLDGHFFDMANLRPEISKLKGLKTSEITDNKLAWIESLILKHQLREKVILSYPSLASIYYLNDSSLYLGYPWSHFLKEDVLRSELKKDCISGKLKAIFIDQDFKDSPSLIKFVRDNCELKSEEKHGSIEFLSF